MRQETESSSEGPRKPIVTSESVIKAMESQSWRARNDRLEFGVRKIGKLGEFGQGAVWLGTRLPGILDYDARGAIPERGS